MIRPQWKGPKEILSSGSGQKETLGGHEGEAAALQPLATSTSGDKTVTKDPVEMMSKEPAPKADIDMETLTSSLAITSLGLVPPSVARKQKKKVQQSS
jgi:hypothetical protein